MNRISNNYPDSLHIEWAINNICNYKCNYCDSTLNGGTSGNPDYHNAVKFFDYVHNSINPNKKMISLSGGEPTLWPQLTDFLNNLNENYYTSITTNGSRTTRWWTDFINECKRIHRVTISIHPQYADIEHIISVCEIIQDKVEVALMVMFDKNHLENFNRCIEKLKSSSLRVYITIKPIVRRKNSDENNKHNQSEDYTEQEKNLIKSFTQMSKNKHPTIPVAGKIKIDDELKPAWYGNYLLSSGLNKFKGWKCEIGSKRLAIWYDGNVYPAFCGTGQKIVLGNINNLESFKKIDSVICNTDYCGCLPELRVPKEKLSDESIIK